MANQKANFKWDMSIGHISKLLSMQKSLKGDIQTFVSNFACLLFKVRKC